MRIGTTYLPVQEVSFSVDWYVEKLGAKLNYMDEEKAILNLADQAIFLVKAKKGQNANFIDSAGNERFSLTFEVDGEDELETVRHDLLSLGVSVGSIEDRGHPGRNFVFTDPDGNLFDVWSQLSPAFKEARARV